MSPPMNSLPNFSFRKIGLPVETSRSWSVPEKSTHATTWPSGERPKVSHVCNDMSVKPVRLRSAILQRSTWAVLPTKARCRRSACVAELINITWRESGVNSAAVAFSAGTRNRTRNGCTLSTMTPASSCASTYCPSRLNRSARKWVSDGRRAGGAPGDGLAAGGVFPS